MRTAYGGSQTPIWYWEPVTPPPSLPATPHSRGTLMTPQSLAPRRRRATLLLRNGILPVTR